MSKVRRRKTRYRRGHQLSSWQRWCIRSGSESPTAFANHDERMEAYEAFRDRFIDDCDDLADGFDGFWKWEPGVPDELRRSIGPYDHVIASEPLKSEIVERREALPDARRAWLGAETA